MSLEANHLQFLEIPMSSAVFILSLKNSIVKCYQVNGKYKGGKNLGIRTAMYKYVEYQAYYSPDRAKSIWYNEDSTDLHVALWFRQHSKAKDFHCFLGTWHLKTPLVVNSGDAIVEEKIEEILVEKKELCHVLLSHYKAEDSESPVQSLQEFGACQSSVESVVSLSGHFAQLQSIEKLSVFNLFRPYRCHIKPTRFKKLESNENNLLAGSWTPFQQAYDGLKTQDVKTEQVNIPLLALKPLENDSMIEEMVGIPPTKRRSRS